jgi:hypothetical protein
MFFNACCFILAMQNAGSKAKSGDKPPKIVSHLKSDYVKDGEPVTLSCRIIGMLNSFKLNTYLSPGNLNINILTRLALWFSDYCISQVMFICIWQQMVNSKDLNFRNKFSWQFMIDTVYKLQFYISETINWLG